MTNVAAINQALNAQVKDSAPRHLSYFSTTIDCGAHQHEIKSVIEPLYTGFRNPDALRCSNRTSEPEVWGGGQGVMDVNHLITADSHSPAARHAKQRLYFDLGASMWPESSQKWMVEHYKQRGIVFDRILMWEAKPLTPTEIHAHVSLYRTVCSLLQK